MDPLLDPPRPGVLRVAREDLARQPERAIRLARGEDLGRLRVQCVGDVDVDRDGRLFEQSADVARPVVCTTRGPGEPDERSASPRLEREDRLVRPRGEGGVSEHFLRQEGDRLQVRHPPSRIGRVLGRVGVDGDPRARLRNIGLARRGSEEPRERIDGQYVRRAGNEARARELDRARCVSPLLRQRRSAEEKVSAIPLPRRARRARALVDQERDPLVRPPGGREQAVERLRRPRVGRVRRPRLAQRSDRRLGLPSPLLERRDRAQLGRPRAIADREREAPPSRPHDLLRPRTRPLEEQDEIVRHARIHAQRRRRPRRGALQQLHRPRVLPEREPLDARRVELERGRALGVRLELGLRVEERGQARPLPGLRRVRDARLASRPRLRIERERLVERRARGIDVPRVHPLGAFHVQPRPHLRIGGVGERHRREVRREPRLLPRPRGALQLRFEPLQRRRMTGRVGERPLERALDLEAALPGGAQQPTALRPEVRPRSILARGRDLRVQVHEERPLRPARVPEASQRRVRHGRLHRGDRALGVRDRLRPVAELLVGERSLEARRRERRAIGRDERRPRGEGVIDLLRARPQNGRFARRRLRQDRLGARRDPRHPLRIVVPDAHAPRAAGRPLARSCSPRSPRGNARASQAGADSGGNSSAKSAATSAAVHPPAACTYPSSARAISSALA